jgi:outer membrane biosynthesis protein TonB
MPLPNPQLDSQNDPTAEPRPEGGAEERAPQPAADAPLTFIPHTESGAVGNQPMRIATGRYGELEAHEIVHLLGTIEDERARARFRESIYISFFVWLAIAWFVFYGPRVLWHAPQIKLASDAIREHELTRIIAPVNLQKFENKTEKGTPRKSPTPQHEAPHQALDAKTLGKIKEMARVSNTPAPPPPPSMAPPAVKVAPDAPAPTAMTRADTRAPMPSNIPDAPRPQASNRDSLKMGNNNPSTSMSELAHTSPYGGGGNPGGITTMPARGGSNVGAGAEILSDTQGVDFTAWMRRTTRGTLAAWGPLLPEEIQPPLSKKGMTTLVITILADGTIADMKIEGSTHDDALNRAAWGSIISQGKLNDLPKEFHGKQIVLRFRYYVNMDR